MYEGHDQPRQYQDTICLYSCPHMAFWYKQELVPEGSGSIDRYHCAKYRKNLLHLMGAGPIRCDECIEEGTGAH